MTAPMSPQRMAEIRADDAAWGQDDETFATMAPASRAQAIAYAHPSAQQRRELLREVDRLEAELADTESRRAYLSDELSRCYKVALDKTGSCTVEPFDQYIARIFDLWKEDQAHHQEHHAREERLEAALAAAEQHVLIAGSAAAQDAACRAFGVLALEELRNRIHDEMPKGVRWACLRIDLCDEIKAGTWPPKAGDT